MKRELWPASNPPGDLREKRGAVKVPAPSEEQKARDTEQARLLEQALRVK